MTTLLAYINPCLLDQNKPPGKHVSRKLSTYRCRHQCDIVLKTVEHAVNVTTKTIDRRAVDRAPSYCLPPCSRYVPLLAAFLTI
jgi:hypothetical protein